MRAAIKNKLQAKNLADWMKTRLKTVMYFHYYVKNTFQSPKVNQWTQRMIKISLAQK